MELLPYFLGFAVVCTVLSIGLQRRTVWMWYLGWVILYLFAGYLGTHFFFALYYANNLAAEGYACIFLVGGLVLWLPAAVWWATHRNRFGARPRRPTLRGDDEATPKSPGTQE
jgi:hypothetical protein